MENNVTVIAERKNGKNNVRTALGSFTIAGLWFVIDLIWFIVGNKNGTVQTWNKVVFIISCVVLGLATLFLLFAHSAYRTNKKLADTPLLTYDEAEQAFVFYDIYENKEKRFDKDDVLRVNINENNDEAHIVYKKEEKEKEIFIGFSLKSCEDLINTKINECKRN